MSVTSDQLRKRGNELRDLVWLAGHHWETDVTITNAADELEAAADMIDTQHGTIRDQNTAAARMAQIEAAAWAFIRADRHEHLACRLSDSEMDALMELRKALDDAALGRTPPPMLEDE